MALLLLRTKVGEREDVRANTKVLKREEANARPLKEQDNEREAARMQGRAIKHAV